MSVPKVKLSLQPIPKSLVRVSIAGEFLKNMGLLSASAIRNVQQAVAEGLVSDLLVVGVNAANIGKERFILRFDPLGRDDTIHLDLSDGRSTTEALDTGLAGAMAYSVQMLKRRALTPQFYIIWSAQALADKAQLASACQRLNLVMDAGEQTPFQPDNDPSMYTPPLPPTMPAADQAPAGDATQWASELPPAPPGYTYRPVVTVRPAKEPGITYRIETAMRSK